MLFTLALAITLSAPAFADEPKKDEKKDEDCGQD